MNEIEVNSKPRRAQGGKGLLSRSIHIQSLHKSMSKIPSPREERDSEKRRAPERVACCPGKEREREKEETAPGGRKWQVCSVWREREERGEGILTH